MNILKWFTGGEMSAEEVSNMSMEEIEDGIREIGTATETDDIAAMALEILETAKSQAKD